MRGQLFLLIGVLLVAQVDAAELQYRLDNNRVTGFRTTAQGPIPVVAGYGKVTGLPDNHLSTVAQPAGCAIDLVDNLKFLTVTNTTTGAITMAAVVCFDGIVVATKRDVRRRLDVAIVRQDYQLAEIYIARCTGGSPPAICTTIRQLMNPTDNEFTALITLIQAAQNAVAALP